MVLVVVWTMAGFALGDIQRARNPVVQGYVFAFAIGILVLIPLTRSSAPWMMLAAGVVGAGNFVVVGLVGVATSPDVMVLFADAVTAVLSAILLFLALRAYRESRSH